VVKLSLAVLSSVAIVGALSGSADDVLPPRFNFDRYIRMIDESPFAVATAAALPEATPDFAKDLYIANAARSPEADMVTLMSSSDQNFKKYLTTREPVDGYGIAQIDWSEDVGKTTVTISKDGKFATLTFNQTLLARQQGPLNAQLAAAQQRQAAPLVPPSVPDRVSRVRSPGMEPQDPEADAASIQDLVPSPPPGLAAIGVPNRDGREGILEQQRRQQRREARLARERSQEEEALRK
jgi:hypothetical protein